MYGGSSPRSSPIGSHCSAVNNLAGPLREQGEWRRAYPSAHPWRGVEHPRAGVGRVWHCGSSESIVDGLVAHILVEGRCVHGDSISLPLAKINDACHCGRCQIGHRCSGPSAAPVVAVRGSCQMALTTRATFSWWGPVRAMSWAPAKGRAKDGRRSAKHRMAALRQKRQDKANQLSYLGTITKADDYLRTITKAVDYSVYWDWCESCARSGLAKGQELRPKSSTLGTPRRTNDLVFS